MAVSLVTCRAVVRTAEINDRLLGFLPEPVLLAACGGSDLIAFCVFPQPSIKLGDRPE